MTFRFNLPTGITITLPPEIVPDARLLWEPDQPAAVE
jgi:hypothetical protein